MKGMRGLVELKILECIQNYCKIDNILDVFDLICGTSTGIYNYFKYKGGILSLGFGLKNLSINKGKEIYYTLGSEVFKYKFGDYIFGIYNYFTKNGWYDHKRLENALIKELGDENILDIKTNKKVKIFINLRYLLLVQQLNQLQKLC
jgi:patatin-like phospholipase/acyl hydrolase